QNVRRQPRRVLSGIPQVELVEISDAALCCGSAGIFNLIEPRAAADLGDRKVQACLATEPDVIVSGNPGCLLQLGAALARAGRTIPVLHTIQLLDYSLRGVTHNVAGTPLPVRRWDRPGRGRGSATWIVPRSAPSRTPRS